MRYKTGAVLQYELEVYCGVPFLQSLEASKGTALQMGGVLRYKLEVYCQYFSDRLYGLGVPEQFPLVFLQNPEGPARHLDASRQKFTPHCLAAISDSELPSLKVPPKLPLPHNRGHVFLFQHCPRGEGNCSAIERQKVSGGNFCLAASRCLSGPSGKEVPVFLCLVLRP